MLNEIGLHQTVLSLCFGTLIWLPILLHFPKADVGILQSLIHTQKTDNNIILTKTPNLLSSGVPSSSPKSSLSIPGTELWMAFLMSPSGHLCCLHRSNLYISLITECSLHWNSKSQSLSCVPFRKSCWTTLYTDWMAILSAPFWLLRVHRTRLDMNPITEKVAHLCLYSALPPLCNLSSLIPCFLSLQSVLFANPL